VLAQAQLAQKADRLLQLTRDLAALLGPDAAALVRSSLAEVLSFRTTPVQTVLFVPFQIR